ncbi:hypothetical protein JRQ81_017059 [Phrynocephalus forsythii]|uniref:C-type lectin domain-containing protein n=1 Tax=Phrynocephalus forsythii TaxID=171643 RepID=A0A9Q0XW06_9SAUR|nr:hypothetical protein JRQ81_017059 [Phrynocephalus forsythii]
MAPKKAPEEDAKNPDGSKPEDDKGKNKPDDDKEKPDDAKPDDKGESLNEWNRTADLRYAMYLVKRFMISRDPSYEKKSDVEIISEADKIAQGLALVATKLNELEEEIAEIQYKLNHDWMAHKNALYTFNKGGRNLKEAIDFCKSEKATMEFVQSNVHTSFNTYWLGAYKYSSKNWIWTADNTTVKTFYWATGKPSMTETPTTAKPHCLTHRKYCGPPNNCWMDEPCSEKRRVCCKIKPLKRWMD